MTIEVDDSELESRGFTVVDSLVSAVQLEGFEDAIAEFTARYLARTGRSPDGGDAFVGVLTRDQEWRETLFPLLRNLHVVQQIAADIARRFETAGIFDRWGFEVPLAWPSFRADPPAETTYLLPMHQDYESTRCHRALRLWIPLRDADAVAGTIAVVPGSHTLGPLEYDVTDRKYPHIPGEAWGHLGETVVEVPAGSGVLLNPLVVHRSVPATNDRMKYVLLIQIQDLAAVMDPSDDTDELGREFRRLSALREAARTAGTTGVSSA